MDVPGKESSGKLYKLYEVRQKCVPKKVGRPERKSNHALKGAKSSHRALVAHRARLVPSGLGWFPLNSSGPLWDWACPLRAMLALQFQNGSLCSLSQGPDDPLRVGMVLSGQGWSPQGRTDSLSVLLIP